jgi:hypothetical protein
MTEILTESFCERCGTRYTFETARPRTSRIGRAKTFTKGLRNYVLSDDSFSEAMADARGEEELQATVLQLDAFHKTFNFCLDCRQYTCGNCWNAEDGRCQSCAPLPGGAPLELAPRATDAIAERLAAITAAPLLDTPRAAPHQAIGIAAWPTNDLPQHEIDEEAVPDSSVAEPPVEEQAEAPADAQAEAPADVPVEDELAELEAEAMAEAEIAAPDAEDDAALEMLGAAALAHRLGFADAPESERPAFEHPDAWAEPVASSPEPQAFDEPEMGADQLAARLDAMIEPAAVAAVTAEAVATVVEAEPEPEAEAVEAEPVPEAVAETETVAEPEIVEAEPEPEAILDIAAAEPETVAQAVEAEPAAEVVEAEPAAVAEAEVVEAEPVPEAVAEGVELESEAVPEAAAEVVELEPEVVESAAVEAETAPVAPAETPHADAALHLRGLAPGQSLEDAIAAYEAAEQIAEAVPEPEPVAAVEPEPVVAIGPAPEPVAEVVPQVIAEPVAEVMAEPEPEVVAEAVVATAPEPVAEVAAVEPAPEPVAEVVAEAEPEPEPAPEPVAEVAAEPEPAPEPEPEPVAAVEPEAVAAPEPEAAPEPAADVAPAPEPVAEVAPEPIQLPVAAAAPVVLPAAAPAQDVPPIAATAASPEPATVPQPSWLAVAPDDNTSPSWPERASWPTTSRPPMTGTLAGRKLMNPDNAADLWAASAQEVMQGGPLGGHSTGQQAPVASAQPCVGCGLQLSATARFCRRCGTRQN